jgi:hypothetical protein
MAGPYKWRAKGLLAKIEATYGTDAVPDGDDNALLPIDVNVTALDATEIERKIEMPWMGSGGKILVSPKATLNFSTEFAGGGTPLGTPPAWAVLLRACGMAETVTETTKVEYDPITGDEESLSFYYYLSGNLHTCLGARGAWKLNLAANDLPTFDWTFTSLFQTPTAAADVPDLTITDWKVPVPATKANTTKFTYGAYQAVAQSLSIDSGTDVQYIGNIGRESVEIVDRAITGSMVIESPSVTDQNFFDDAVNRTRRAFSVTHGTASGNKITVAAPGVEAGAPQYSQQNGIVMMTIPLTFPYSSGNDEIKFTCI